MPASLTPALVQLAHAMGVATEYWDWNGHHIEVPAETVRTVLAAMDVQAEDDDAAQAALAELEEARWRQVLPPCVVTRAGRPARVPVHLPHGTSFTARVLCEDGDVRPTVQVEHNVEPRAVGDVLTGEAMVEMPADLPLGYHELEAETERGTVKVSLISAPDVVELPPSLSPQGEQRWGVMAQLYQPRSAASWGMGDLADLADLGTWAAEMGADFFLVNPLHASEPSGGISPSPYYPVSRRFLSPLYIRPEDIPEVGYLTSQERRALEEHADAVRELNAEDSIDRTALWEGKQAALRLVFSRQRSIRRERAFRAFCEREGQGLLDFATWCALREVHGPAWREWPEELRDPRSEAVSAARAELAREVEFWCWLQWIAGEQLEAAHREMTNCGMQLGVITDLAVGVSGDAAEAWTLQHVFAQGVGIGAPPDAYNQLGQGWGMPPMRPDRLAEMAYGPFRDMLRTVLRASGGVRIDHILGLFRLWWIPDGAKPTEGTYVRFDHEAMVSVLALEAHRAGVVVIGEDLGTVEGWVRDYLASRGILGTSILWFEWNGERPMPPEQYRELCLSTVTTHDLPPTAGYLEGVHVDLRDELGLLSRPIELERAEDEASRDKFLSMLRDRGLLRDGATVEEEVDALHRLLSWTPSKLVGVAVADLAGDRRPINQPGTSDEYANWRLPLAGPDRTPITVEELVDSDAARRLARCVSRR